MKKLITIVFAMLMVMSLFGMTWEVQPGESIQDAIDGSSDGDTVYVYDGIYVETLEIWNRELILQGESRDGCIIQAPNFYVSVIYTNSWTDNLITVQDLTVQNGLWGIFATNSPYCNLNVNNVKVELNEYGIVLNSVNSNITNCTIDSNNYTGLYIVNCDINITDCIISNNNYDSDFETNTMGGGVYIDNSSEVVISGTEITNNHAYNSGGGLAMITATNTIEFDEENPCTIEGNTIEFIYGEGNDLYVENYTPGTTVDVYMNTNPNIVVYPETYWIIIPTSVEPTQIPETQILSYNFPNPVSNYTTIYFMSDNVNDATVSIYNAKGQKMSTVVTESGSVMLDTSNYTSGVYFYKIKNSDVNVVRKMIVIK
ncbi:MAG: T9SS type A sorting domain-containing protein [Candidatus Tenebribacter davisii]|nr:T9SS type A sorting domain-containing protein [Candidatus Tenebribacter davisii]